VTDDGGSVSSRAASLTLIKQPIFRLQPVSRLIILSGTPSNVTLTASAFSSTPVRYQWLFDDFL